MSDDPNSVEWPESLPSVPRDVERWLWAVVRNHPDFAVALAQDQISYLSGYVCGLPAQLPNGAHETGDHSAERASTWPRRFERHVPRGALQFSYLDELPCPHPYDVGVFLRQVLAYNEACNKDQRAAIPKLKKRRSKKSAGTIDHKADAAVADRWLHARSTGQFRFIADFAKANGCELSDVNEALDRDRHRRAPVWKAHSKKQRK